MGGNAVFRQANTAMLSVCAVEAPVVMSSAAFDERLTHTYERLGLKPGPNDRTVRVTLAMAKRNDMFAAPAL